MFQIVWLEFCSCSRHSIRGWVLHRSWTLECSRLYFANWFIVNFCNRNSDLIGQSLDATAYGLNVVFEKLRWSVSPKELSAQSCGHNIPPFESCLMPIARHHRFVASCVVFWVQYSQLSTAETSWNANVTSRLFPYPGLGWAPDDGSDTGRPRPVQC